MTRVPSCTCNATCRFYFIRYQYRQQAVSAVLATKERYGTRVPEEKGNPQRLIKAKDIVNKPSCSRQMATKSNVSILSGKTEQNNFLSTSPSKELKYFIEIQKIKCICAHIPACNIKEENLEDVEVFIGNINVGSTEVNIFTLISWRSPRRSC